MENRFIQKIPLNPPLPKGEDAKKDSRQAGMTDKCGLTYELLSKSMVSKTVHGEPPAYID